MPEEDKEKKAENLKVESLDDLFDDIETEKPNKEENSNNEKEVNKKEETTNTLDLSTFDEEEKEEAPILPQIEDDDDTYDLQKELEAKFDELFGTVDEE